MELKENSIIIDHKLDRIFDPKLNRHFSHAYCTAGECEVVFNNTRFLFKKGDCMIIVANRLVSELIPSADFEVKVIFIEISFMQASSPHSSYGARGGLLLFINPMMQLTEQESSLCNRDFDNVIYRMEHPHKFFHGDEMMAALQMLFVDFFEFSSRIYGEADLSTETADIIFRFIQMLERGDYVRCREVKYYASELCVTPKYLSEICKKVGGCSANWWIDRYVAVDLIHLLKDRQKTLTEIADHFGFSSLSQFTRYVRNTLGSSPSTFRK